jgi:nucleoside-diphosphate-sugar epimerase
MDAITPPTDSEPLLPGDVSRSQLDVWELQQLVRTTQSPLRALAGASILITGATGWFGVWLLDLLCLADDMLKLDLRIAAVSREPQRFLARFQGFARDSRISWIRTDVRQLEATAAGYSHVIHAAADTSVKAEASSPLLLFDTIVDGTRRTLAAAGPGCKSFLLLSSGAVYGPAHADRARFRESESGGPDPSDVQNGYSEGKRAAEQICAIAASAGVPVRIARCFAFVGPHMPFDKHFAIGNFIADAVRGQPIRVTSDGCAQRSYLYMTDLMRALLVILADGLIGRAYNVGSEVAVTIGQLAHCVDQVVGGRGVVIEGEASAPGDLYVPDTTRLRAELHFTPEVGLEAAIARTAAWYRSQMRSSASRN